MFGASLLGINKVTRQLVLKEVVTVNPPVQVQQK